MIFFFHLHHQREIFESGVAESAARGSKVCVLFFFGFFGTNLLWKNFVESSGRNFIFNCRFSITARKIQFLFLFNSLSSFSKSCIGKICNEVDEDDVEMK